MNNPQEHKGKPTISVRLFEPSTMSKAAPLKILLLKFDHIGDFITGLNAFRIIREAFKDAEITMICLPALVDLAQNTGLFDKVKGFAAVPESEQLGEAPAIFTQDHFTRFRELLDEPYFLAADFKHDPFDRFGLDHVETIYKAAFAAQTQGGLSIVIPTMEWDTPASSVKTRKNLPVHSELRLTLLAHAIVETLIPRPSLVDCFMKEDTGNNLYKELKADPRQKIGLSIGAGSELRKWNKDYWIALFEKIGRAHNAVFVFFGSKGDKGETLEIIKNLAPGHAIDLTGAVPLSHLPAYMNLLDAYIGCDTGLTHMAASLGLPTVNIFAGISNVTVWRAQGPKVKTVYAEVICAPCHLRFKKDCPNNNVCMGALVPDVVYACFEQVLAG